MKERVVSTQKMVNATKLAHIFLLFLTNIFYVGLVFERKFQSEASAVGLQTEGEMENCRRPTQPRVIRNRSQMRGRNQRLCVSFSERQDPLRRIQRSGEGALNNSTNSKMPSWLSWLPRLFAQGATEQQLPADPPSYSELFALNANDDSDDESFSITDPDPAPTPTPSTNPKREAYIKKIEIIVGGKKSWKN
jgi:hypothetical protein